MQRTFNSIFFSALPLATLGCSISLPVQAQVTPDGTTTTTVNQDGNNFVIEQGDRVGDNLFHSFNEFSVPTLGSAAFNNAGDIANIFSRVTGSNISSIDGLLSANSAANLYLINPNGIIFGENARLDLGGSFFASTADSLLFEGDAEFSASNPQAAPLLEVSIPIGANFRDNPGNIVNQGNLAVEQNFTFSGNNLDLQGELQAGGGLTLQATDSILLGSSASINSFSDANRGGDINVTAVEDIVLDSSALISASSDGNQGGNINLTSGNEIRLGIFAGILTTNGGDIQLQANQMSMENISQVTSFVNNSSDGGDIQLSISEKITIDGGNIGTLAGDFESANEIQELGDSGNIIINTNELEIIGFATPVEEITGGFLTGGDITSDVSGNANAGDIEITASKVRLSNGSQIRASTFGTGDAGNITVKASDSVEITGINLESNDTSKIATTVNPDASGNGKDLRIETNRLIVGDGAQIQAGVLGMGQGGNININATQSVEILDAVTDENPTGLFTGPEGEGGMGKGGSINIKTPDLSLLGEDSQISNEVDSAASGDAGNTFIEVKRLIVTDGARISNGTFNTGKGGNLEINASEFVDLFGTGGTEGDEEPGGLLNATFGFAEAGNLTLNTGRLEIRDGASITASTFGFTETGKSGSITINASESIEVVGTSGSGGLSSNITSEAGRIFNIPNSSSLASGGSITILAKDLTVEDTAEISTQTLGSGDSGDVTIQTQKLIVQDSAQISADSSGAGKAGTLTIFADDSVKLAGKGGFLVQAIEGSAAGNLILETNELTIADNGFVNVSSLEGQAGNVNITANSLSQNQGQITAETGISEGDIGANINLEIFDTWRIENESIVSASAFGDADGGNININQGISDTEFLLFAFPPTGTNGSDIIANAENANGGRIEINAAGVFGIDFRDITANEASANSLNDFTVSSQFGSPGETIINRTVEDPTSGLINLPASVEDASDQISQNPCQQGAGSEFIVTGKGGLPPTVSESVNSESARVGLIEPVPSQGTQARQGSEGANANFATETVPAMGWVFNDRGEVTLTAYSTSSNKVQRSERQYSSTCKM